MAITKLNSLAIPDDTIVEADLSYPLTSFSSTGIDDNATSTAITIDASENVGIGTTGPSTYDSRSNNLVVGDSGDAGITIFSGASSNARLVFAASGDTGLSNGQVDYDNANDKMAFATAGSDRAHIDSSGNVIIGDNSPTFNNDAKTVIRATDNYYIKPTVCASFNRTGSDGDILQFYKATSLAGSIASDSGARLKVNSAAVAGYLAVGNASYYAWNSTDFRGQVDGAYNLGASNARFKDLYLSGGAYLGGTGSANRMDDYEEGTWEPALIGSSSNPSVTYHADTGGYYIKIGRLVYVTGTIRTTAYSGGSGELYIASLPFNHSDRTNGDNSDGVGTANTIVWNGSSTDHPTFVRSKRNDSAFFIGQNSHDATSSLLQVGDWGTTCMMSFTITYYTD